MLKELSRRRREADLGELADEQTDLVALMVGGGDVCGR